MNQRLTDTISASVPEEELVLAALLQHAAQESDRDRGNAMFVAILQPYSHEQLAAIVASQARALFKP